MCLQMPMVAEDVQLEDFCGAVREMFGADICGQDVNRVFQKISTNPDAKCDWLEVSSATRMSCRLTR